MLSDSGVHKVEPTVRRSETFRGKKPKRFDGFLSDCMFSVWTWLSTHWHWEEGHSLQRYFGIRMGTCGCLDLRPWKSADCWDTFVFLLPVITQLSSHSLPVEKLFEGKGKMSGFLSFKTVLGKQRTQ